MAMVYSWLVVLHNDKQIQNLNKDDEIRSKDRMAKAWYTPAKALDALGHRPDLEMGPAMADYDRFQRPDMGRCNPFAGNENRCKWTVIRYSRAWIKALKPRAGSPACFDFQFLWGRGE